MDRSLTFRALAAAVAVVAAPPVGADEPPLWVGLKPGPHVVGFKTSWQLDYTRRYAITFDDKTSYAAGKAPRPILVNLWYPATTNGDAKRMPHRGYLAVRSADPRLAAFSGRLAEYERAVIAKEVMGKPAAELTDREKALLDQFLDTPTACVRDAAPAPGPFPLVLYHAGAGSSFEDNSVLCEFLASHGFAVVGSAFQDHTGKSLNTDNRGGSAGDLAFLTAHARQLPGVDWDRVGVVGHSAGAQAALVYRSQADAVVDAVVSLDTTQDYHGIAEPTWDDFTTPVVKNSKNLTCPILMVAGPHACFELADSLQHARRYYLTVKDLGHNDYISQGVIHNDLMYRLHLGDPAQTAALRADLKTALDRVREGYRAVCVYVLRFLEAELKGDAPAKGYLANQYRDSKLGDAGPHVEHVPAGRTGPDPYKADSRSPPTPRQLRPFLREHGADKTIAVLRRFRTDVPTPPVDYPIARLNLVSDLLDEGRTREAVALRDYYRESGLDCGKLLLEFGKGYQGMGLTTKAHRHYKKVLLLDPSNGEAADKIKELGAGK